MRIRILPYKQGSKSAKALATALGGKVLKLEGSTFKCGYDDLVINWGNSDCSSIVDNMTKHLEYPDNTKMLNWMPHLMVRASNKLNFFKRMEEVGNSDIIPPFWTNAETIPDEAFPVVCRTVLTGHSGAGIHIADTHNDLVPCNLYVKYLKKKEEYRVHVGRNDSNYVTIAVQRKARRFSVPDEEVNWKVRNLAGGFVYTRDGFTVPEAVIAAAHRALQAVSLDFGAVDVIWNDSTEKAYVLEINTAPGLEGQTVEDYANFFRDLSSSNG